MAAMGRLGDAADAYGRALKTQLNDPQIHHGLGLALQPLGRFNEAAAPSDELVVASLADYRDLAIRLAGDPATLTAIRAKLAGNRDRSALFDTARFARQLEGAYTTIWARHQAGQPPAAFAVPKT